MHPTGQVVAIEEFRKTNHSRCIDYELHAGKMFYVSKKSERFEVSAHAHSFMYIVYILFVFYVYSVYIHTHMPCA